MAAGQLNRTRRALLGAAVGLSFERLRTNGERAVPCRRCEEPFDAACGGAQDELPLRGSDAAIQSGVGVGTGLLRSARNDEWARALAAFEVAEAEMEAFQRRTAGAPWEEQEAVERGMDARLEALYPALLRLLGTPAPDLQGFARKIALTAEYEVGELAGGEACLAALGRDARRLAVGGGLDGDR